ncbi:MAG: inorganic diphosphatase [Patescibacteria group bacterium]
MTKMTPYNKFTGQAKMNKIDKNMEDKYKVIIEIPQGTVNNKYEYDEKSGEFKLDFVFSAKGGSASGGKNVVWPFNYGFFPGTLGGDGDTMDAVVVSSEPIPQGTEVEVKIIGAIDVLDRGEEDLKVICVPLHRMVQGVLVNDAGYSSVNDITDLSGTQKKEWGDFYLELARQKKKETIVRGFKTKKEAEDLLQKSVIS